MYTEFYSMASNDPSGAERVNGRVDQLKDAKVANLDVQRQLEGANLYVIISFEADSRHGIPEAQAGNQGNGLNVF